MAVSDRWRRSPPDHTSKRASSSQSSAGRAATRCRRCQTRCRAPRSVRPFPGSESRADSRLCRSSARPRRERVAARARVVRDDSGSRSGGIGDRAALCTADQSSSRRASRRRPPRSLPARNSPQPHPGRTVWHATAPRRQEPRTARRTARGTWLTPSAGYVQTTSSAIEAPCPAGAFSRAPAHATTGRNPRLPIGHSRGGGVSIIEIDIAEPGTLAALATGLARRRSSRLASGHGTHVRGFAHGPVRSCGTQ